MSIELENIVNLGSSRGISFSVPVVFGFAPSFFQKLRDSKVIDGRRLYAVYGTVSAQSFVSSFKLNEIRDILADDDSYVQLRFTDGSRTSVLIDSCSEQVKRGNLSKLRFRFFTKY